MRWADIEVPNLPVDVDSRGRPACYPRGNFYPLIDGPSTRDHRVTRAGFRPCSTCRSRSQAGFCPCTPRRIANPPEPTFARLRYPLGGDRPSQTVRLALSLRRSSRRSVRALTRPGWYFKGGSTEAGAPASQPPTYPTQDAPRPNAKLQ